MLNQIRQFIGILGLILILIILPIILLSIDKSYFDVAFARYATLQNFAGKYSRIELTAQFDSVLRFIQFPFNTSLDPAFFSAEDISHMNDVRTLFEIVHLIWTLAIIMVAWGCREWQKILRIVRQALLGYLAALSLVGIAAALQWQTTFTTFHKLLFPNNNYWALDPTTSNLIKYLPGNIFQELAAMYYLLIVIELVLLTVILFRKYGKK